MLMVADVGEEGSNITEKVLTYFMDGPKRWLEIKQSISVSMGEKKIIKKTVTNCFSLFFVSPKLMI